MRISILGCGWLGLPLGKRLLDEKHGIKGSTTSSEKLSLLSSQGITPFLLSLSSEGLTGNFRGFLERTEVLIITVPPSGGQLSGFDLCGGMEWLVEEVIRMGVPRVIFISSISVYEDTEDFREYTENDVPAGKKGNSKKLLEVENLLKDNPQFETTIIRFGGLIGPDRHPVTYLAGRKNLLNGLAPVNLVSQDDCIKVISAVLQKDRFAEIYNAVNPLHPTKEAYYSRKARERGLDVPQYGRVPSKGKLISSRKLVKELDFKFEGEI